MDSQILIFCIGGGITLASSIVGFLLLEFLLKNKEPKKKVFLVGCTPGLGVAIGMTILLTGMPVDPSLKIPREFYLLCSVFWIILWIFFVMYEIATYPWRPKESPIIKVVKQLLRKKKTVNE